MSDRATPENVDPEWIAAWQPRAPGPLARTFADPPRRHPGEDGAAEVNRETVSRLLAILE